MSFLEEDDAQKHMTNAMNIIPAEKRNKARTVYRTARNKGLTHAAALNVMLNMHKEDLDTTYGNSIMSEQVKNAANILLEAMKVSVPHSTYMKWSPEQKAKFHAEHPKGKITDAPRAPRVNHAAEREKEWNRQEPIEHHNSHEHLIKAIKKGGVVGDVDHLVYIKHTTVAHKGKRVAALHIGSMHKIDPKDDLGYDGPETSEVFHHIVHRDADRPSVLHSYQTHSHKNWFGEGVEEQEDTLVEGKDVATAHKVGDTVWAKHPTDKSKTLTGKVSMVGRTGYNIKHKDGTSGWYPHKDVSAEYPGKNAYVKESFKEYLLDENYNKHAATARIYDREMGMSDDKGKRSMAADALKAHTRAFNTAPNDTYKAKHQQKIGVLKKMMEDTEIVEETFESSVEQLDEGTREQNIARLKQNYRDHMMWLTLARSEAERNKHMQAAHKIMAHAQKMYDINVSGS